MSVVFLVNSLFLQQGCYPSENPVILFWISTKGELTVDTDPGESCRSLIGHCAF